MDLLPNSTLPDLSFTMMYGDAKKVSMNIENTRRPGFESIHRLEIVYQFDFYSHSPPYGPFLLLSSLRAPTSTKLNLYIGAELNPDSLSKVACSLYT